MKQQYGAEAIKRVDALIALMDRLLNRSDKTKLVEINNFFNQIAYRTDMQIWHRSDYWATRMEFLGQGAGDCEDYAFAKYFTLKQLGIKSEQMRAFYCKSLTYNLPHLVLAFFRNGVRIPYILGNYNPDILPANERRDLKPIKLYNSEDLYIAQLKKMGKTVPGSKIKALEWIAIINGIQRQKEQP